MDGLVSSGDIGTVPIGVRKDCDRFNPFISARSYNAQRDLAAVGDKEAFQIRSIKEECSRVSSEASDRAWSTEFAVR